MPVNPSNFDTAIGAMVPGSVVPVSICQLTPVQELLCIKIDRSKKEFNRLFHKHMDEVYNDLWGI